MVAITVILAAVIGTFVLGLGDQVQDTAPQASFNFEYENVSSGVDTLTVTHDGGDTIQASNLNASVNGATDGSGTSVAYGDGGSSSLFGTSGDINAGNSDTIDAGDFSGATNLNLAGSTVRVVFQSTEGDSSATLGRFNGPEA
jgi:FlaG/FlaF family flagellin (archaellin)